MILDRFRLTDRVGIVTGAGRGIGAATAVALAEAGADVVIAARSEDQLAEVASRVKAAGRRAVVVVADLNDLDAVAGLVDSAREAFGRLDIVVNNVGGSMPQAFAETSPRHHGSSLPFQCGHRPCPPGAGRAPHARRRWRLGRQHLLGRGSHRRAGLCRLWHGQGGIGSLHPLGRSRPLPADPGERHRGGLGGHLGPRDRDPDPELRSAMEEATPLRRIGDPEDIAAAVVYLSSPAGSFITGKVLEVDGGLQVTNLDMGLPDL